MCTGSMELSNSSCSSEVTVNKIRERLSLDVPRSSQEWHTVVSEETRMKHLEKLVSAMLPRHCLMKRVVNEQFLKSLCDKAREEEGRRIDLSRTRIEYMTNMALDINVVGKKAELIWAKEDTLNANARTSSTGQRASTSAPGSLENDPRVFGSWGQNLQFPGNSGQNLQLPGNSGQNIHLPANSGQNLHLPGNSGHNIQLPGNSGQNLQLPGNSGQNLQLPGNSGQNPHFLDNSGQNLQLLGNSGQNLQLPGNSGQNLQLPGNSGQNLQLPGNSGQNLQLPSNSGQNLQLPSNSGQNLQFPGSSSKNFQVHAGSSGQNFQVPGSLGQDLQVPTGADGSVLYGQNYHSNEDSLTEETRNIITKFGNLHVHREGDNNFL